MINFWKLAWYQLISLCITMAGDYQKEISGNKDRILLWSDLQHLSILIVQKVYAINLTPC